MTTARVGIDLPAKGDKAAKRIEAGDKLTKADLARLTKKQRKWLADVGAVEEA